MRTVVEAYRSHDLLVEAIYKGLPGLKLSRSRLEAFAAFPEGRPRPSISTSRRIVVGANGQGKTSLLMRSYGPRRQGASLELLYEDLLSKYSATGSIRVALELALCQEWAAKGIRTSDGKGRRWQWKRGRRVSEVPEARLNELLWPQSTTEGSPRERSLVACTFSRISFGLHRS